MDLLTQSRIQNLTNKTISSYQKTSGGYTPAERWRVVFADGSSLFAKIGTTPLTADWLRREHHWYGSIAGDFMPAVFGFEDHLERPLLLLEDLSSAHWPPPWSARHLELLREAMSRVAKTRPLPADLLSLELSRRGLSGWNQIARDPAPFLSLGLCSAAWLERALPLLQKSQDETPLEGEDLIHFDLRSDNLCFPGGSATELAGEQSAGASRTGTSDSVSLSSDAHLPKLPAGLPPPRCHGERVVLIDWNGPARGNRLLDLAAIAPSLRMEGGPTPEEWSSEIGPFAAIISGYFAANAGLPVIPNAPRVRWIQLRQLRQALPWAVRVLGLPALDLKWGRVVTQSIEDRFLAGEVTEQQRQSELEEVLIDAYLSSDDPRAQSGKSGDEDEWRWSRELLLDALAPPTKKEFSILDVGCANGYLMESIARWATERGIAVEPYGLEISARMASLARRQYPQWAERIWVGDVREWEPPMRFDLVHVGLDYVPTARQREMLERLLERFLTPDGRVVIRAERVASGVEDIPMQLARLGFSIGGVLESVHSGDGIARRTAWIARQ